jgi:hypothetical protein
VQSLGLAASLTCSTLLATAFAGPTHTRLTISSLEFLDCKADQTGGAVVVITRPPYFLHVRNNLGANSWEGGFELPVGSQISIQVFDTARPPAQVCEITVRPQSVTRIRITDNLTTLVVADPTVIFNLDRGSALVCPDHRTRPNAMQSSGTDIVYAVDTRSARITATSPVGG